MNDDLTLTAHSYRERDPDAFALQIATMRDAMRAHLDEVSLRRAAREVGMSPSGLSKFVNGAEPYIPTIRKLRLWFAEHRRGMHLPRPHRGKS